MNLSTNFITGTVHKLPINESFVFRGNNSVTNGTLGKFDPSLLENDTYTVRLTAVDTNGRSSSIEEEIEVTGDLKLGNFRLSFTDLTIPVTGIPISLTRTYDSLTSGTTDDFGYGWRMEFRDTDLRTSLKKDPTYEELGYRTVGFEFGTRIYITLPGGKREGFTFSPQQVQGAVGGLTGGRLYYPSFVSDKGVTSTLTVPDAEYKDNTATNQFATASGNPNGILIERDGQLFNLAGRPYVPQDDGFGNRYLLTTKDGTQYEINATTGDLESVTDTNGNVLTYSDTEIKSSTGVSVTFERDNQGRITSVTDPLGQQVVYGYDSKGDLVSVTDRDGNETKFEYDDARAHYLDKIVDPLGREAVKTEYDELGRLKKVLDVNGQGTTLAYDPNNSSETILDSYGKPTTYIYDSRGNVVNQIAANGGITTRTYDDDNNQLSETDADGVTTTYTYDNNRNITSIVDANGNVTRMAYGINNKITSVTSPTGLTTTATYDSRGNLTSSTDTNGLKTTFVYDANGRPLSQTSADGQTIEWGYDSKGNPIKMVDSQGNTTNSIFDANGQIQTANSQFTLNGQTYTLDTNFTYDKQGRALTNTNSKGNSSNNTFNVLGQLISQTDNLGNITTFKYDSKGQLIEQILPDNTPNDNTDNPVVKMEYDTGGRKISETSATGLVTRYVYDDLGRLIDTIIPDSTPDDLTDNPHLKTEYTLAGRIKAKTDIYGNREEYTYNNLGQEIQMKDVLGNITKYTYDQGGKLATVLDLKNRLTSYRYDNKGRLIETTYFDNSKSSLTYDELNRVKTTTNELGQTDTYEYDKFGQVTAVINALSEKTSFEYDQRGNLIKITDANQHSTRHEYDQYARKTATIFADNSRITFAYDKFDRVTTATDENTHRTEYFYDNLNQLIKVKQANGAETKYTYDNLGRLISTIDPNQNLTAYTYDQFNRTTAVILPLGQRNKTVYDKYGQTTSTTDYNGDKINYSYDQYGRLSQKSFTNPNLSTFNYTYDAITSQLHTVIDGRGTTTYTYDNKDRLASMTNPDGKAVNYGYDLLSNVTSLQTAASTTTYTYDKLNRLDLVKEGTRTLADYDYDAVGNLSQTKLADGSTEVRNYDVRNRLTQITTKNSVGYTFSGFTYTLDAVGNRMKVVENNGRTVDYQYDILNRLTNEQITDSTNGNRLFNYTYDLAGNRLTKGDSLLGVTNYSYDTNNRLTQTGLGTTITQFTYDNNGSMINRTDGTNTVTYNWANDGENRLLSLTATNPTSTTSSQYVYDAMGSRVASTTDGIRTNYLVAGNLPQVLLEYDANGVITADYTQGLGLIRKQSANREGFYHTDALGSTRLITDNVGLVLDRYNYDAFGANLNQTNTFANSFQFAGEQRDGTGLDYLRARYYDPSLGRFISKDPYAGSITDPYSQHSYQYAHANPVRYTDPTGYFTMGEALQTIALAGIIGSTSASIGYVGTKYLLGQITAEDTYDLFGDWVGGFGNGVSGGISTDIYSSYLGAPIKPRDGFLWNMGNVAGISTSFLIGLKVPILYGAKISQASWLATYQVVTTGYGAGKGIAGLADGKWEFNDVFNLLSLLPLAAPTLGTIKGIAGMKAGNSGGKLGTANAAADEAVQGLTGTQVKVTNCFVAGTEILTIDGIKNIEEIEVGDWVIADDPNTVGEIEYKQVLDTFVRHTDKLVDLYIDGEVISTTGEHPFWTPDKGWVEAKDLVVGSLVQTEDGRVIDVDGVEQREGDFTVYNFKVEGFHTYFVSDLGILVHNTVCGGSNSAPNPALEGNPYHPDIVDQRIRPPYRPNPAHDPRTLNPRKTPEPVDAEEVYGNSIRAGMGKWFGMNNNDQIYQFFYDNAGGVHFSGIVPRAKVPNDILKQL
jgi:large repetitive protein